MDSALKLRLAFEKNKSLSDVEIANLLAKSQLVKKMTSEQGERSLFYIFKLIGLAEIPFVERLDYTQMIINYVNKFIATPHGFSYTGESDGIVPCYNAMLLEAYTRLGLSQSEEAQNALTWIKKYQLFERNQETSWTGKGICSHGGCLKSTPCFIGIGKTVRALITYNEYTDKSDSDVTSLITAGVDYMLRHQFFLRLSADLPISKNITHSAFPQSYFLTLTDLVYIIGKCQLQNHPQAKKVMKMLEEKQVKDNQWKIDYIYNYKGYMSFDNRRGASEWLSALYPIWLGEDE